MHAHDRTLLARLGFNDQDKGDPRHDLACQYLAIHRERVAERLINEKPIARIKHAFEVPISKGHGQYKTTIGFLDLCIWAQTTTNLPANSPGKIIPWSVDWKCQVEVKAKPVPIGDALRQIALYREYIPPTFDHPKERIDTSVWALVTLYPVSDIDLKSLADSRVSHIYLGSAFEKWSDEQQGRAADPGRMFEL